MWYLFKRTRDNGQHHSPELVVSLPLIIVGIRVSLTPGTYYLATEHGYSPDVQVLSATTVFIEQPHDPMPFPFEH